MTPTREAARRAAGTIIAGGGVLVAGWMLIRGFDLALSMCALGGCSEPEDESLGNNLMFAGLVVFLLTSVAARPIAGLRLSFPRWLAAVAAAIAASVGGLWVVSRFGAPTENLALLAPIAAFVGVLVPPRSRRWGIGLLAGALVAAAFGDGPLPGIALAVVAIAAGAFLDAPSDQQPSTAGPDAAT